MSLKTRPQADEEKSIAFAENTGITLAQSFRVSEMPGLVKKKAFLSQEEHGFVIANGNTVKSLAPGPNSVGWAFLGLGHGGREVVRMHNRPFRLRMSFQSLLARGYETLVAVVHLTASIESAALFNTTVSRGRGMVTSDEVAGVIAAGVDDLLQVKVAGVDAQALLHDAAAQKSLSAELEGHLARALEERGLRLVSIDLVAFHNPNESGEMLSEISALDAAVASGQKPGREDVQKLLERLRSSGVATPQMVEKAWLLYDGGTTPAFIAAITDIAQSSRRRIESQAVGRSVQLAEKVSLDDEPVAERRRGPVMADWALLLGALSIVGGAIYWLVPGAAQRDLIVASALGAAVVLAIVAFVFRPRGPARETMPEEERIVIRLDRWAKKKSMQTDQMIRRQIGREFTTAQGDVNDAKLEAFNAGNKPASVRLGEIEARLDVVRAEVEAAPALTIHTSQERFPTQRVARLIAFEEEVLRHARNISIRAQRAKESTDDDNVNALANGIDHFRRTFAKRQGVLEGFREL